VLEGTGEGDVVDVVPRPRRVRALLPPAGHAGVDEARVAGEADVGTETEPLGDAGAVAPGQDVGPVDQPQRRVPPVGLAEVDRDRPLAPGGEVVAAAAGEEPLDGCAVVGRDVGGPGDGDHLGPEVGEDHGAERPGAPALQLDDLDPGQRTRHSPSSRP
jgi:hypothetical protein